jgi:Uma2 family endonuclease
MSDELTKLLAQAAQPITMTEAQFIVWMDEDVKAEFVDGKVIIVAPESSKSERLRWFIGKVLSTFVEHHGLGEVFGPNFRIRVRQGLWRVPDLLFVARERAHLIKETYLDGAPDLVMEIVSPDSVARDWREKYLDYEQAGVREYWVIDPQSRRVDVYHLGESGRYEALPLKEGIYHSTVVIGFFLRPEQLWQEPLPKTIDLLRELGIV